MITRKRYSQEFKRAMAHEVLMGILTAPEVSKREGITSTTLYKWRDMFFAGDYNSDEQEISELKK